MPEPVIKIQKLKKSFEDLLAVDEITLTIEKGEMFALVGPDGAGKTTTIRMLCGILQPTAGNATILGYNLLTERHNITNRIGYLSQRFSLYGDLSVDENIEFFAGIHNVRDYYRRRDELLEYMRLTQFRNRYAEQLSGGMKQKLALACTLIHNPEIIFLDEPTTGVDPVSRRDFWKILSDLLKTGITIFLTTPYLDEAERCNRVGLMNNGKLMVVDSPSNVKAMMQGTVVELICSDIRRAHSLIREKRATREIQAFGDRLHVIVDNYQLDVSSVESLLSKNGITISSMRVISTSLENVFISLMQRVA